jgi:hypothetical protein
VIINKTGMYMYLMNVFGINKFGILNLELTNYVFGINKFGILNFELTNVCIWN